MKIFRTKPVIHHFKIHFPIPETRIQSCVQKLQQLTPQNTQAIFVSINGICLSPNMVRSIHSNFNVMNEKTNIPIFTFLEDQVTSMTYLSATCGVISANPYCIIGDVGQAHLSYYNIHKLLKFLGVKVDHLASHDKKNFLWNAYTEPSQNEKQTTQKWLNVVEQNMVNTVSQKRNIPIETVNNLRNKLFSPKQALTHKLIDHIQTMEQFKEKHFPQVKVEEHVLAATSKRPNLGSSEVAAIMQIQQVLEMPRVALLSMEDPMNQCIRDVIGLIKVRMEDPQKLQQLDMILGEVFQNIQSKIDGNIRGNDYIL